MSFYERGMNIPGAGMLVRIAQVGGVTVDWLLNGTGGADKTKDHGPARRGWNLGNRSASLVCERPLRFFVHRHDKPLRQR